ncbi:PKD domain-containing protein [Exilibacterium tricleocarpae]|nr:PKD domain-containing protein [Exilibacterium tricleocarpae]
MKGVFLSLIKRFTIFFAVAVVSDAYAVEPVSVRASANDGNVPANTLDNSLSTRWSAEGNGQWIEYDLGGTFTVTNLGIAFHRGDQRTATVDIQVSSNATAWTTVWSGAQPRSTLSLQDFDVTDTAGRYVRVVGYGNTSNNWNSITEVEINPSITPPDPPAGVTASASSDDGNVPANVLDGNLNTRWSANGDGQYITFDLGSLQVVRSLDVAFYRGNQRTTNFEIHMGATVTQLRRMFTGTSSGASLNPQTFDFPDMPARFVRIIGRGNSENSWISLTEVALSVGGDVNDLPPVASFTGPDMAVIGSAISFDGSGSFDPDGGMISYSWTFGDGGTSTVQSPSHTYYVIGNYTVALTISDDEGDIATATQFVEASDNRKDPIAIIAGPASAQVDTVVNFDGSGSTDPDGGVITVYAWDFGDGTTSTAVSPQKTYTATGVYTVSLTVTDDEGTSATASSTLRISSVNPASDLWPLINPSFELSTSEGGWLEDDSAGVVSMNGTSNPQPPNGGRLLRIKGNGGLIKQAIYKPIAGHVYEITAFIHGHGTIGINDIGSDTVYETSTNHGSGWQQVSVTYVSTGSPALVYAKYGPGSGDALFDMFAAHDISTPEDLAKPPPPKIMRYASQVLDLSWWKITLPINNAMEIYTPELLTYELDPWFKLVQDADGYAVQFRANHGGATTSGSSNPRSELREMMQNYHFRNSKSAAKWSNTQGVHEMWIKQKVTRLTSVKPHVVVGQIHDGGDDVTVFRIEGLLGEGGDWDNNGTPGVLDTHAKLWITDGNNRHGYLVDDNYELGTVFTVKFIASNGKVEYEYNGQRVPYVHTENFSGAYFKLGNYTQSHNGTAPGESNDAYAQTYVYDYYIRHQE